MKPRRRSVLQAAAMATPWMLARPLPGWAAARPAGGAERKGIAGKLLSEWCDGLLRQQIVDPNKPAEHGAFRCDACGTIHGRGGDAVYPLLRMAKTTGQEKYVAAAVRAVDWMKNVDSPDGAFLNDPGKPKSWKGITVFASIALGEAIHWHGSVLEPAVKVRWLARLRPAAKFIFDNFTMDVGNINYPVTASYALTLLGDLFDEPRYREKGRTFAHEALRYLSTPSRLLFGEGHPQTGKSPKGLPPVDLGYNVEESLPSLVLYGLASKDEEVLGAVTEALAAHLEFMLPDGGWDNSWGTRNYKWTYWGSRTSDGCQPAYALMADRHPAFMTAAIRNAELLRACTHDGLLYGGPHYVSHHVPACVHHTFCHAKALTTVLDRELPASKSGKSLAPLPREIARGARRVPELDVVLLAQGPWRATVSGYDWHYRKEVFSGGGGALSMLWHRQWGPVLSASLTADVPVEANNQQTLAGETPFCLTPRVELRQGDAWFSHLFDSTAQLTPSEEKAKVACAAKARLCDAAGKDPAGGPVTCELSYRLAPDAVTISAQVNGKFEGAQFMLPVVAADGEPWKRLGPGKARLKSGKGVLVVESSGALDVLEPSRPRVFNQTPGFSAVPFVAALPASGAVTLTIRAG